MAKYIIERRSNVFKNILHRPTKVDDGLLEDLDIQVNNYWQKKAERLQERRWRKIHDLEA